MIRVLPPEVVDRIAAGEVVERPAAVVKELVENALDAGATRVTVHLEEGGKRLIKISDNGAGIEPEELGLAFLRHATSKLNSIEDLDHIASLGFRGEALASIGAVSRMRITSRRREAVEGAQAENEGGAVSAVRPAASPPGTTVEVRNLFYNVPARLKFLKTESTELSHCLDWVVRFALAYPETAFTILHNGRKVVEAEAASEELSRIAAFFGKETAENLVALDREILGVRIKGFLGAPELGRRDLKRSLLFLNGRHVKDRTVHAALQRAYREVMPEKLQPSYFLHLGMPPFWVDVNVHPTKTEVRFADGARVFSAVHRAAADLLANRERAVQSASALPATQRTAPAQERWTGRPVLAKEGEPPRMPLPAESKDGLGQPRSIPGRKYLVLFNTYAAFAAEEGLAILDCHALHERVLYEALRREYEQGGIRLQRLLLPARLDLDPGRAARMDEILAGLKRLGIEARAQEDRLEVLALPALLRQADPGAVAGEVLERVAEGGLGEEVYRELLMRMACRAAVKAGHALSDLQIDTLLEDAEKTGYSGRCPHGRPTTVVISRKDLEELFKRRGF